MTIKLDNQEPNVFPLVEGLDVRDAGRTAEVIFATKVEGQLATLTIQVELCPSGYFGRPFGAVSEK
jgi:hypothetical protein